MKTGNTIESTASTNKASTKSCSVGDIGNILVSSVTKALLIDSLAGTVIIGHLAPKQLTYLKIATDTVAAFVSYATREYATTCLNDMQYVGGLVGGTLKYGIKGSNLALGAVNNLGYEICNYNSLNSNVCAITLEAGEEVFKSLTGMDETSVSTAFFNGMVISSVLIASVYTAYLPADKFIKANVNFTAIDTNTNVAILENRSEYNLSKNGTCSFEDKLKYAYDAFIDDSGSAFCNFLIGDNNTLSEVD